MDKIFLTKWKQSPLINHFIIKTPAGLSLLWHHYYVVTIDQLWVWKLHHGKEKMQRSTAKSINGLRYCSWYWNDKDRSTTNLGNIFKFIISTKPKRRSVIFHIPHYLFASSNNLYRIREDPCCLRPFHTSDFIERDYFLKKKCATIPCLWIFYRNRK